MNALHKPCVLIVTHNHKSFMRPLIESCKSIPNINKYICDAASTDGTLEEIRSLTHGHDDFHILAKTKLEGFAKNNNDLIRYYSLHNMPVILLNPDCSFIPEAIYEFLGIVNSIDNLGIAAPTLSYPNGLPQVSWRKFPTPYTFLKNRISPAVSEGNHTILTQQDHTFKIEWALGAFLYISSKLNTGNGVLDERYRLYCEDSDICLAAHHQNRNVVGVSVTGITHDLQEKSKVLFSKYSFWNIQSAFLFLLKWRWIYFPTLKRIRTNSTVTHSNKK